MIKKIFQAIGDCFNLNKRPKKRNQVIFDLEKAAKFSEKYNTPEKIKLVREVIEELGLVNVVEREVNLQLADYRKSISMMEDLIEERTIEIARLKQAVIRVRAILKLARGRIKFLITEKEKWAK